MGIEGCLLAAGRSCKPKGPCSCVRVLRISKHEGFRALRYVKNPSKGSKEEFGFGVLNLRVLAESFGSGGLDDFGIPLDGSPR